MQKKPSLEFEEFASDVLSDKALDYVEVPIGKKVFFLVGLVAILLVGVAFGRLIHLNVVRGSFYTNRAIGNVNREKVILASRGVITDRFGEVLAQNADTFSIFINVSELLKDRSNFDFVLIELSDVLGVSIEEFYEVLEKSDLEKSAEVAIARNISSKKAIAVKGLDIGAVHVENDFTREYADGKVFSSVLGYIGSSDTENAVVGKAGLERSYDNFLRGQDGAYTYYRNAIGEVLDERITAEPEPGKKIVTTIDGDFQRYFYSRLRSGLRSLGLSSGAGVAINPKNGEVLALVSFPTYDNNIFTLPGKNEERLEIINNQNKPLFNRVVSGMYSPGSAIKPLMALAALHEEVIGPRDSIYSKGYIEIPNPYFPDFPSRFLDWKPHGYVDVRSALARSSNVYFYEVGGGFEDRVGLGINKIHHYWEKFGFGSNTGIDLEFENSGFLPEPDEKEARTDQPWRIGDTYNISIGQGDLLVSPLQLINFIASIANDGKLLQPLLVREIVAGNEKPFVQSSGVLMDYSDWEEELEEVQYGMRDAVVKDYGTAKLLGSLPLVSAGKTGSAQISNNTKTNAFFVGYGPFEDPEVAILILIEEAKEGSLNAVPVAQEIMGWYYKNRVLNQ